MDNPFILAFPEANHATVLGMLGFVLGLFALAIGIELFRRRRDQWRRLNAEWESVRSIARDREMTAGEIDKLETFIRRWMRRSPLRAATDRVLFNACVREEMETIRDPQQYLDRGVELRDMRKRLGLDYVPIGNRIHSTRELYAPQAVWTTVSDAAEGAWREVHISRVDEGYFYIAAKEGEPLPAVRAGDTLRFRLWRDDDARYLFTSRVETVLDSPPELRMAHTYELSRRQARAHYRMHYDQMTDVALISAPADHDYSKLDERPVLARLRGRIVSLSGGGFAVALDQPVAGPVLLRVKIHFDASPFEETGRVIGSAPISGGRHLVRAAFAAIEDEHRDKITRYIFHMQQRAVTAETAAVE